MAWDPKLEAGERAIVEVNVTPREGVHFGILLTDKRFFYSRKKKGFVVSDAWETVTLPRSDLSEVSLTRKKGWFLRAVGAALIVATAAYVLAFMFGQIDRFSFGGLMGFVFGGACFVGSSNRWDLRFLAGGKSHKILQPLSSSKETVSKMADALQAVGREFSGPSA